jgi:hypothetical protein
MRYQDMTFHFNSPSRHRQRRLEISTDSGLTIKMRIIDAAWKHKQLPAEAACLVGQRGFPQPAVSL